jgi:outer membrane protein insertion porin family
LGLPGRSLKGFAWLIGNHVGVLKKILLLGLLATSAWAQSTPEETAESVPAEAGINQEGPNRRGPFSGPTQGIFTLGSDEGFGIGPVLPDPTSFDGSNRTETVLQGSRFTDNINLTGRYGHYFTPTQRLMLTALGGTSSASLDVDYSFVPEGMSGYFSAYVNQTRSQSSSFLQGSDVGLAGNNHQPWIYRSSAGFAYTTDPSQELILSSALVYENLSVHDGPAAGMVAPLDRLGNPLTVSPGGIDRMLMVRVMGLHMDLDDLQFPTRGQKFRFSAEQAIGVSSAPISWTRLNANMSHFQSLGSPTLILNLQAGIMTGTVPPYEAYNLGGTNSVRGYQLGELGGGSSFLQSSIELRQPLGELEILGRQVPFRLNAFVDYGTAFGTASRVFGQPAVVRNKPDSGFSYGLGVQALSDLGLIRLEGAWAAQGRSTINLSIGDRY